MKHDVAKQLLYMLFTSLDIEPFNCKLVKSQGLLGYGFIKQVQRFYANMAQRDSTSSKAQLVHNIVKANSLLIYMGSYTKVEVSFFSCHESKGLKNSEEKIALDMV